MQKWLILAIASVCYAYNGCLHQRSICLRTSECRTYFDEFENICAFSLSSCTVESPSDCVHTLWKIRSFFPFDGCVCYEAIGFTEQCNHFRELIWNHPCERKMTDAGEERRALERSSYTTTNHGNNISQRRTTRTPLSDQIRQLKTQLSGALGTSTRDILGKTTCDKALNDICLRHVSCRQLWRLFRSSCGVDQDNRCTMTDRETCWQSFEGLSWTGLGKCHCESSNSDCHWIRLHTNYNKCIHEISKSGGFILPFGVNATASDNNRRNSHQKGRPQSTTLDKSIDIWEMKTTLAPSRTTTKWTTTTSTTTTTTRMPTTVTTTMPSTTTTRLPTTIRRSMNVVATFQPREAERITKAPQWNRGRVEHRSQVRTSTPTPWYHATLSSSLSHPLDQQRDVFKHSQADVHYRPLFEAQLKTTPNYYYYYTTVSPKWVDYYYYTTAPKWVESHYYSTTPAERLHMPSYERAQAGVNQPTIPKQKYSANREWNLRQPDELTETPQPTQPPTTSFIQREYSARSSCQDAMTRCEAADECRLALRRITCEMCAELVSTGRMFCGM
ncbi:hypothetical protein KIN20_036607 [Parelaphostrongylus tenuis]|uniref:GDNF/GAS1 domain-containing protein n=1 Tax=Parelaphostrongylus tenuis TaxID=148309 RepID=A0AAD5RD30_PARTN|nr:hypothetical protein KIN20_036607 [Parelaphostrongylus tenuis]